jgi:hypothetical protein
MASKKTKTVKTKGKTSSKTVTKIPKTISKKKKGKKRGGRYKTGIYNSPKCSKPVAYRSGWELEVCQEILDKDPEVLKFEYESLGIPYIANPRSGKTRRYFPDFFVYYASGRRLIVEVKRDDKVQTVRVQKKAQACIDWCEKESKRLNVKVEYEIWSSKKIKLIKEQVQNNQKTTVEEEKKSKELLNLQVTKPTETESTKSDLTSAPASLESASLMSKETLKNLTRSNLDQLNSLIFGKKQTKE